MAMGLTFIDVPTNRLNTDEFKSNWIKIQGPTNAALNL